MHEKTDGVPLAYLELLKSVLTGSIFPENTDRPLERSINGTPKSLVKNLILDLAAKQGIKLVKRQKLDAAAYEEGRGWPSLAYTMVGRKRLNNVQLAIETVIAESIPGDIVECGVWRGGCAILMRAILKDLNIEDRTVWSADSFEGLPKPNAVRYPADEGFDISQSEYMSVSLDIVRGNFERFGVLDGHTKFLKGWFKDTLPTAPIEHIAVLRADGDLYESTMDILSSLYDKVSDGGFIIIDDYYSWEPCKQAVTDFRLSKGITSEIIDVDWTCVYWRK